MQRRGPLFDALWQARLALGLEASAEVAISCSIRSPVVLGILRPLIVIPADLVDKLRADELELVLMHELAHVRRYDNFTLLLQRLITVVLFFHPDVWLCGYLLRREAEQACDDLVICSTGRSEDYARGLTNVAELAQLRNPLIRRIPVMNVFSATESDLALRIRRTLSSKARRMCTRSRILAAVLLCAWRVPIRIGTGGAVPILGRCLVRSRRRARGARLMATGGPWVAQARAPASLSSTAFWLCRRFSAWVKTNERSSWRRGPSIS